MLGYYQASLRDECRQSIKLHLAGSREEGERLLLGGSGRRSGFSSRRRGLGLGFIFSLSRYVFLGLRLRRLLHRLLFCFQLLGGFELHRGRVQAVAKTGLGRAVVENVAQVRLAATAANFGPRVADLVVGVLRERVLGDRFVEAGPAALGVELGV